jgi:hypothetical protein
VLRIETKQQLFSFYTPALEADVYKIEAVQEVRVLDPANPQRLAIYNFQGSDPNQVGPLEPQYFNVVAPQFSLPANAVHSHYPPDGHQDEGRVLPHVIFDDNVCLFMSCLRKKH